MNLLETEGPIIACSTSLASNSAISVLRISGFKDITNYSSFFSLDISTIQPRKVYFTNLLDKNEIIDSVCLTYFKGPKSYNGENILELSIHGNILNVERVMALFTQNQLCRIASPGEFTLRALKNKKLTLSQVEGLDVLLNASTPYALKQGSSLLAGDLYNTYENLFQAFLNHKSALELSIDFSDDVGEEEARSNFDRTRMELTKIVENLSFRVQSLPFNLIEPTISLFGLPNAGKSTLFNQLLGESRSIVSSVAGTTRDFVSEAYSFSGVRYKLIDTAGIRSTDDIIEKEGVRRSLKKMQESFFKILLINPFDTFESSDFFADTSFDLICFTHSDLPNFELAKTHFLSRTNLISGPMGALVLKFNSELNKMLIDEAVNKKYLATISSSPILLERHKSLILKAKMLLSQYQDLSSHESDVAVLSSELNSIGHCISELIGIVSPDDVLNNIFNNFCIGK
jgi:tRNA modification GTPase